MQVVFIEKAWIEYQYWQDNDRRMIRKINSLLKDISRHPLTGMGKPEMLKHDLAGKWSRRIDHEHRLVYRVEGDKLMVYSCRFHYEK
jgi:toxin YoeB